ncbi:Secondary metabolism regulator LAE1, partial [Fusarium oxysporum f. sp. albedinis]
MAIQLATPRFLSYFIFVLDARGRRRGLEFKLIFGRSLTTISAKLYERRCPNPLQNAEAVPRGKCHKRKRSGSPRNAHDRNDTTND